MQHGAARVLTRRTFLKAGAALATMFGIRTTARAGDSPEPPLTEASRREVDARYELILARRGSRLGEDQRAEILKVLKAQQPGLERFREYPLSSTDQPAPFFRVYRRNG